MPYLLTQPSPRPARVVDQSGFEGSASQLLESSAGLGRGRQLEYANQSHDAKLVDRQLVGVDPVFLQ